VYDEVLHVPFIVRAPGLLSAGRRVSGTASLVDVVPTLLDLLGIPVPAGVEGVSLAGRLRGADATAERPVYAEVALGTPPTYTCAVWTGSRKCIVSDAGSAQCFDTGGDPGEQHPLTDPELLTSGRDALRPYRERLAAQAALAPRTAAVDDEKVERLRALGYVP
jgi:arylsulfatase A-like enzyme